MNLSRGECSYDIREVNLFDVKVGETYSKNETCAKAREQFIKEHGFVNMMVLSASLELLLNEEIYNVMRECGKEKAQAIVITTPEDANQHVKNLFGFIPTTYTGKAEWLEYNQPYYKEGGAGYYLRMDTTGDDDTSLKAFLGGFIDLSHTSVQKLMDIRRSEGGAAILRSIDEGKCSVDRGYKICKSGTARAEDADSYIEDKPLSAADESGSVVIGGNTPVHNLKAGVHVTIMLKFAELLKETSELLFDPSPDYGCSIKVHKSRKGKLESYSCTRETCGGMLTITFKPNEKEVYNGTE